MPDLRDAPTVKLWRVESGNNGPTLFSGTGDPSTVEKMGQVPEIVVHGDADDVVPVTGSRAMVEQMKKLGVEVKYIEVPGGNHVNVAGPNMAAIFDFFDAHRKGQAASAGAGR